MHEHKIEQRLSRAKKGSRVEAIHEEKKAPAEGEAGESSERGEKSGEHKAAKGTFAAGKSECPPKPQGETTKPAEDSHKE